MKRLEVIKNYYEAKRRTVWLRNRISHVVLRKYLTSYKDKFAMIKALKLRKNRF